MTRSVKAVLSDLANGTIDVERAEELLAERRILDLGVARLDLEREERCGFPEAVLAEGKDDAALALICRRLLDEKESLLVTRLRAERVPPLLKELDIAGDYCAISRVLRVGQLEPQVGDPIAIVSAGTSDRSVAQEVKACSEWAGLDVRSYRDVGIAGLERLLRVVPELEGVACVVAVAGMDGALPTVLAGLVSCPVLAVPTSVGYGAAFGGIAPLLTMLNACAPGVAVLNIDNGFGAAVMAHRIVRVAQGSADRR